ncbi:MAG: 50S ribosomal protein L29 [Deltaproteobacteria bacterium]|jgi:large subunit ribosomal protein L29|nr:50S ribosomal protein L29 [Deltaproteobacteria bacterium]MBW1856317.1 50S ribosomal protein L29 [Deltaproteobacteria bacterium]MBW2183747.1 50S ribosomal protein L29 [Deltaproteobacteria bacterium]MCK5420695.1 50S ribosomal protein L29 [Deltaproteobacteria bacterium]
MKASDLRELTVEELQQRELDLSEELFNLKFQLATAQLENKMRVPQVKKDLARIKTLIKEKQRQ